MIDDYITMGLIIYSQIAIIDRGRSIHLMGAQFNAIAGSTGSIPLSFFSGGIR